MGRHHLNRVFLGTMFCAVVWQATVTTTVAQGLFGGRPTTTTRPTTRPGSPPPVGVQKRPTAPPQGMQQPGAQQPRPPVTDSGEALWIWAPVQDKDNVPVGPCYFRKTFDITAVELAMCQITCDDQYELFVNGQLVGSGNDWRLVKSYDIAKFLVNGRNVISVKAENTTGGTAGMVARVTVRRRGSTDVSYDSNTSWRASTREMTGWQAPHFVDTRWPAARSFGEFGVAQPWGDKVVAADGAQTKRFVIGPEYRVERLVASEPFKSLLAMAFTEFGEILVSQEKGPLQLVADRDQDGVPETLVTYCDQVQSCQGILPLSGEVFVVAHGPQGAGLYRITDADNDGRGEKVTQLYAFDPDLGEHGPHGLTLGPDGMIYVIVGNHAKVKAEPSETSPYRKPYEGDLFQPKYEDPNGHAVGIKAPGGTIVRCDLEGKLIEVVAGGLRNAYDLAFDQHGELFTYDSDMESDMLLPWYRPTRILHVTSGAEFGSRSGWSVWPNYFVDGTAPVLETHRGSPTGIEVYNHHKYPAKYHGAMFLGDWSQGRILAVRLTPKNGTYVAESETFLEGRPMNVVDLAVGPDGWLYFCTGGRGTDGGVYRVVWKGQADPVPEFVGVMKAIRQPQINSAFGRQSIAMLQQEIGDKWDEQLTSVVSSATRPGHDRARAIDLMLLYGTPLDAPLIDQLAKDNDPHVRAKVAYVIGLQPDDALGESLVALLGDRDALVRRQAAEAVLRGEYQVPPEYLVKLLADPNRNVAYAARRALEHQPVEDWKKLVLEHDTARGFIYGAVALLIESPNRETALEVVERGVTTMAGFVSDDDFIDLLRVFELALSRGELKREDVPKLCAALSEEFPAGEMRMNRELARLVAYLQEPGALERMLEFIAGKHDDTEKLQVALHLRYLTHGWSGDQRLQLLTYLDKAQELDGGNSLAGYIDHVRRDFCKTIPEDERAAILARALEMPGAALSVLATMEAAPDAATVKRLIALDVSIAEARTTAEKKLQTGVIAILAVSGQSDAMAYLREVFDVSPERRADLAMGMAQQPDGDNWPLLVRSLGSLEGAAAQEVLAQLTKVNRKSTDATALRSTILLGLKLGENGGQQAAKLLQHWTGQNLTLPGTALPETMMAWQKWYTLKFPDLPPAALPVESQESRWNYQQLVTYLTTDKNGSLPGNPVKGASVFEKAQCSKCHRFRGVGEAIGPDLSSVSQRFQRKELLESILFPSQVISDQYASKTITTVHGLTYTGMVAKQGETVIVLQSNGQKATVRERDVDEMVASKKSAMPEGLLNPLTLEEIADLVALLASRQSVTATAQKPGKLPLGR